MELAILSIGAGLVYAAAVWISYWDIGLFRSAMIGVALATLALAASVTGPFIVSDPSAAFLGFLAPLAVAASGLLTFVRWRLRETERTR
jgi:hypothetical protein